MAKKKQNTREQRPASQEGPATLKDLLSSEIVGKLKAQAEELKSEENARKEAQLKAAEEARKAEQKRLDNDFGHLLDNSKQDWRKFK